MPGIDGYEVCRRLKADPLTKSIPIIFVTGKVNALSKVIIRKTDLLARYGGEEFACVLPNTNEGSAFIIAEKLRLAVAALNIPHALSTIEKFVTIRVGVTTMMSAKNSSGAEPISAADQVLYLSKKNGRNMTSC
ncbi:MAG: hypothetical protein BGN88_01655 [Clostridiales bacterium 43-6]|nr:MAG: hypothetical protein BGN88_01655 [Clostridiales bacterium 43-6]